MDKLCLRSYIKSRQLLGLIAKEIHAELATTYGHGTVSYRTVARWDYRFPSGRESIEGDPRQGRPIIVVTQKRIDAVKDLVNEDPHISIDYLAYILDISHGSVDTILEQHLRLKRDSHNGYLIISPVNSDNNVLIFVPKTYARSKAETGGSVILSQEMKLGSTIAR